MSGPRQLSAAVTRVLGAAAEPTCRATGKPGRQVVHTMASSRRRPMVCVLILNYNGKGLTIDCVRSVLRSVYNPFRVVVIDNGSIDGSAGALRAQFGGRIDLIVNERNVGYAAGFNVGLAYGYKERNADYCLVMNNDTVLDRSAVAGLVRVAETDERIGFVTGKVYYYDQPNVLQTIGKMEDPIRWNGDHIGNGEIDNGQYDRVQDLHFSDDIFTLVRRRLYLEIGGYNELFYLQGEEYDWQARAKKAGYRIVYTPHARIWHKVSMTLGKDSARKAYYDARNPMLVVLIHQSQRFFRRYFWDHFRKDVLRSSLVYLKQGRLSPVIAKWQGLLSGMRWGIGNKRLTAKHLVGGLFG